MKYLRILLTFLSLKAQKTYKISLRWSQVFSDIIIPKKIFLKTFYLGGGSGLGKHIAIRLAQEGCNIAICDINLKLAQKTCEELKQNYNICSEAFKVDVSDKNQINELRKNIEEKMGNVEILVNNAGILSPLAILEGDDCDVQKVLDVNIASHFWVGEFVFDNV